MYIIALDCETTHKGGPDHDSPEAQYPSNEVVRVGWQVIAPEIGEKYINPDFHKLAEFCERADEDVRIVAHNAKFDIKWFQRYHRPEANTVQVWCTMTYDYLNTGHESKFISLEDLCKKHGIRPKKTMDLGEYIAHGGRVEDIPLEELDQYLERDVDLVRWLAFAQGADKPWNYPYDMSYIQALAEMELNGLPIDQDKCKEQAEESIEITDDYVQLCKDFIMEHGEWKDGSPITMADFEKKIKPTANRTLSWMLTGAPHEVKTTSDKWTFRYKGGRSCVLPATLVDEVWEEPATHLGYSMDEAHISEAVMICLKYGITHNILGKLPTFRKHDKLASTYYMPFLNMAGETGCVHPKLNTTATATGRLSSSKPNGQNLPTEARQLVKAPRGMSLVELDFSQLELVALAYLCKDDQMLDDLKIGEDIHYNSGQRVMGWEDPHDMTKKDRTLVKNVNFGAVYGGKAPGLAAQTGVDKKIIQDLINSLYRRYPGIADWQKATYELVVENMEPNGHDDNGEQMYKSTVDVGERTYTFFETPSPRWLRARTGRNYSFNPNQVYNYPIQGFAGWRIVLQFLGDLWSNSHPSLMYLMTVHDSILVAVDDDYVKMFESQVETQCAILSAELGLPFNLEVDFTVGKHWS